MRRSRIAEVAVSKTVSTTARRERGRGQIEFFVADCVRDSLAPAE
jgi:hypothetical protein